MTTRWLGCIDQLVDEALRREPDSIAVRVEGRDITRGELRRRALGAACRLRALGIRRGERCGVSLTHSLELLTAILGTLWAGGVCVPLDPSTPPLRARQLLANLEAPVLLSNNAQLGTANLTVLQPDGASSDTAPPRQHELDDLAFIFHTGGSTGQPKPVMQTHRQVCHGQLGGIEFLQVGPGDRVPIRSPITVSGIAAELLWALLAGGVAVVAPEAVRADAHALVRLLRDEKVSILLLVPSLLRAMLDEAVLAECVSLRHVVTAGESLGSDVPARLDSVLPGRLVVLYGTTEAPSTTLRTLRPDENAANVGWPVWCKRVYVLDDEAQPLPAGTTGEIFVGGGVAQGYWGMPEETARRFLPDPFSAEPGARMYRTGDVGRLLADGSLELVGRGDDQIKIRGFRVEPAEIEAVLRQHPAVREAVVRTDERGRLGAWLTGSATEVRSFAAERLPSHMVPTFYVWLDNMPRTAGDKIDRRSLPPPPINYDTPRIPPRTEVELTLVKIWRRVLEVDVGVLDEFETSGGNSLLAMQVLADIEREFGRRLPLNALMEGGSVEQVARLLRDECAVTPGSILRPLVPHGERPPFFIVHGLFGGAMLFGPAAQQLQDGRPVYGIQAAAHAGHELMHQPLEVLARQYIEAMRGVQARGPYRLGGYSMGGVVAFEMARQLRASGDNVALLALFDSFAPDFYRLDVASWMARIAALRPRDWSGFLRQRVSGLRHLVESKAPPLQSVSLDSPPDSIQTSMRQALRSYRWRVYDGDATLFMGERAQPPPGWAFDPCLGWSRWIAGELEVRAVPGRHLKIFSAANVPALAKELRTALARADVTASCL